ncbi:Pleckstrin homology domain-containing protein [Kalaharituber pfeilii]|nr:Pleckstrin homology domain-containing protein [Kalaharituber pfeilii]
MTTIAPTRARGPTGSQGSTDPNLENSLDPNSYTIHRLHHATAPHLHVTTRRIFIGPVPKGWLKNHRGEWYKHHLHMNYSRREATFTADANVVGQRKLTNINFPQSNGSSSAANGDQLIDMAEALDDSSEPQSTTGSIPIPGGEGRRESNGDGQAFMSVRSTKSAPMDIVQGRGSSHRQAYSTVSSRPGIERGESWQTASESFGGRSPIQSGPSDWQNEALVTLSPEPDDAGTTSQHPTRITSLITEDPAPMPSGSEFGGSIVVPSSLEASHSLASLLMHDNEARKKKTKSPPQRSSRSLLKTPSFLSPARLRSRAQSQTPDPEGRPKISTNNDRVAGGMVRFNTAVDIHERDRQLQLKLAELSRRRTLRSVGRHSRARRRDGEIIKMENMLVRVECVKATLPVDYDDRESIKYDTQVLERWREFIVVCREGTGEDNSMYMQLYKSRTVPAIDRKHISSHSTLTVPLTPRSTHVNLYSSLDKSLVIWHPRKSYTFIYILRPRCSSSSIEWYTFLRKALGWQRPESLQIVVPYLEVTLTIGNPFDKVEQKIAETNGNTEVGALLQEEQAIAGDLIMKSMDMLRKCHQWDGLLDKWMREERMGLAWRKYDRLEWIHGVNEQRMYGTIGMQRTHVLELRPKIHYPTETKVASGEKMIEPAPVEGFLVRLSRGTGRHRQYPNLYFAKRYYWSVHDNLLCFCRPARALPPAPPKLNVHDGVVPPTSQLIDKIPIIYGVAPYELDAHSEIEWLKTGNMEYQERRDLDAYNEAERKVNTLLRAEGFIDLTKVEKVQLIRKDAADEAPDQSVESPVTDTIWEDGATDETYHEKVFKLVLTNGLDVKFQTHDKQTRDEWVTRLRNLVVYWKARDLEDMTLVRKVRNENLKELHIDEEMEALVGQRARKWEVSYACVSPELYHACGLSSCRAITMSGTLYRKPRKHSTFARYYVVLCHGELILFHESPRKASGEPIPHIHHERHSSVPLQDCFIYSGTITSGDLIYHPQTFDTNGPVRHALPRIYKDGLTSQDEEPMLCFVLWHGRRKGFRTGKDQQGNTVHTIGTRLGMPGGGGKALVFKAPSRVHRDVWVMNIAMEIERLHTKAFDDITVKP